MLPILYIKLVVLCIALLLTSSLLVVLIAHYSLHNLINGKHNTYIFIQPSICKILVTQLVQELLQKKQFMHLLGFIKLQSYHLLLMILLSKLYWEVFVAYQLALPTVRKRPFTSETLNDMVQAFQTDSSLGDMHLTDVCMPA